MKNTLTTTQIILMIFVFILSFASKAQSTNILAKIKTNIENDNIYIYATAQSNSEIEFNNLTFELISINKTINRNFSKNKQSGKFSIMPGSFLTFSKQKISIDRQSSISILLNIIKEDHIISSDYINIENGLISTQTTAINKIKKNSKLINKNVFSKQASDFCMFLKQINSSKTANFPFVVEIKEMQKLGTQINEIFILVNGKEVYKFRTLEKLSYLYAAAQETNKRLDKYTLNNSF